jgi:hypothetical protein
MGFHGITWARAQRNGKTQLNYGLGESVLALDSHNIWVRHIHETQFSKNKSKTKKEYNKVGKQTLTTLVPYLFWKGGVQ